MHSKNINLIYRIAQPSDSVAIATLHTESWQLNYTAFLSQAYLAGPVISERKQVWKSRFESPSSNQKVWVCMDKKKLAGFACLYIDDDIKWGCLLDNLHVSQQCQRQNIGHHLMRIAAQEVINDNHENLMYLWVLCGNKKAIKFYEKIGGENVETAIHDFPPGHKSEVYRYSWRSKEVEILAKN